MKTKKQLLANLGSNIKAEMAHAESLNHQESSLRLMHIYLDLTRLARFLEDDFSPGPGRKVVQMTDGRSCIRLLCEDGSIWRCTDTERWVQVDLSFLNEKSNDPDDSHKQRDASKSADFA